MYLRATVGYPLGACAEVEQGPEVARGGRTMGEHDVVEVPGREVRALASQIPHKIVHFGVADVIGRQLRARELGSAPLAMRLALLLEALLGHKPHRLVLWAIRRVLPTVQDVA